MLSTANVFFGRQSPQELNYLFSAKSGFLVILGFVEHVRLH